VGMLTEKIPVLHLQNIIRSHLGTPILEWNWWSYWTDFTQDCTPWFQPHDSSKWHCNPPPSNSCHIY